MVRNVSLRLFENIKFLVDEIHYRNERQLVQGLLVVYHFGEFFDCVQAVVVDDREAADPHTSVLEIVQIQLMDALSIQQKINVYFFS